MTKKSHPKTQVKSKPQDKTPSQQKLKPTFAFKKWAISVSVIALIGAITTGVIYNNMPLSDKGRIKMGIHALNQMVKTDGKIVYNIDFLKNKPNKGNNIVREMGTTYAMAFAFNQTNDPKLQEKLIPIFTRARKRCISTVENACMISDNPEKLKVGATALALLAELFYEKTSADTQFSDLREKWVNAIVDLYVAEKGVMISPMHKELFYQEQAKPTKSKGKEKLKDKEKSEDKDQKKVETTSPYFDGESWFALSVYHDMYPDNERVTQTLASLDDTLFKIYQDTYLVSFVHWGLMASAQRYGTTHDGKFLDFMKKQFKLYVERVPTPSKGSSTCSVSEGLGDVAYFVNHNDDAFVREVINRINENKIKIDDLQVISTEIVGKNAEKYHTIHPQTEKYIGAFKNTPDSYKTRNDITQHCLTALLKRQRALKGQK